MIPYRTIPQWEHSHPLILFRRARRPFPGHAVRSLALLCRPATSQPPGSGLPKGRTFVALSIQRPVRALPPSSFISSEVWERHLLNATGAGLRAGGDSQMQRHIQGFCPEEALVMHPEE